MKHLKNIVLSILAVSLLALALPVRTLAAEESAVMKPAPISADSYTDIEGTWFEEYAQTYGYSDVFSDGSGLFNPDQAITRMQFARLLHKALNININYFAATDISEYYSDVKNSDIGANELYDLATLGIIDAKDSFRPDDTLDRDEMMHYIMNAFIKNAGDNYPIIEIYRIFEDDADIKSEFSADVQHACALRLVNGRSGNYLFPRAAATRAEAVTLTGKLVELLSTIMADVTVRSTATEENGGLRLTLTLINNSDKTVKITHSSQQLFDFKVFDGSGNTLYCWSANRMFAQVVTTTTIEAGKELALSDTLDPATYSAFKSDMETIVGYITGTSDDFAINPDGYFASTSSPLD
ncbi:MAG: BsuPI-related putative proteinase inhibitor [Oscillospiraceae bacterium]|nr:BsuPI-related putative proteinase inhibitor [Oscillospiraceae bacterium]